MTNPQNCGTCKMIGCKDNGFYSHYPEECNHFSMKKGCASHSDFQSERGKFDELIKFVKRNAVKQGIRSGWILKCVVIDKLKELRQAGERK